jgi:hypothetical protein
MYHAILATVTEALAAGFGTAVALVVLGTFLLRWYRMRQEFALMKVALEKGMTPQFMPTQPQWLISLRQGVMIIALGVGLTVIGAIGWNIASKVQRPGAGAPGLADAPVPSAAIDAMAPVADRDPPPGPGARGGEDRARPKPPRPAPPPRDPAMEAWDRARDQINVCMAMVGSGIILMLLGVVRITFVPAERRLVSQMPALPAASSPTTSV